MIIHRSGTLMNSSISSLITTSATTWRNNQGSGPRNIPPAKTRIISALAFVAIGLMAVVETGANAILLLASLTCLCIDGQPSRLAIERLTSSAVTVVGANANLIMSFSNTKLMEREEAVRFLVSSFIKNS